MKEVASVGTRIFVGDDNMVRIIPSNKAIGFMPLPEEKELFGVSKLTIEFPLDGAIEARIEVICIPDIIDAEAHYFTLNPQTGMQEEIQFIKFKSGKEWGWLDPTT